MRLTWTLGALGVAALVAAVSCQASLANYGPPPPCNPDAGLCPDPGTAVAGAGATSTGVGGAGASTGAGGFGAGTTVTGEVDLITSPDFSSSFATPYQGTATLFAYPAAGGQITTTYTGTATGAGGGTAGATYAFPSVPNGPTWFFVSPAANSDALPTLSPVTLPSPGSLSLPVVEQMMVQNIASSLPSLAVNGVSSSAAQIVVIITNAGTPYQGVSVAGSTGGATVVYDTGDGVYSDSAAATGLAGTVILFNSGLRGRQLLTFTDMNMKSNTVEILAGQGAITLASLAWQ